MDADVSWKFDAVRFAGHALKILLGLGFRIVIS
jgi:hypothetical protein